MNCIIINGYKVSTTKESLDKFNIVISNAKYYSNKNKDKDLDRIVFFNTIYLPRYSLKENNNYRIDVFSTPSYIDIYLYNNFEQIEYERISL